MRAALCAAAVLAAGVTAGAVQAKSPETLPQGTSTYAFDIVRDGKPIGTHEVTLTRRDGRVIVDVDVDIRVKLGFLTLFKYEHENREIWENGRLVCLEAKTNDDGTRYEVLARAVDGVLQVEGSGGSYEMPGDTMTATYWNPMTVSMDRMLDTAKGKVLEIDTAHVEVGTLDIAGRPVTVRQFRTEGDLQLDSWYGPGGEWLGIAFVGRGKPVRYVPRELPPIQQAQVPAE